MAEGLLRARLTRQGLADRVRVRSAGIHGLDGSPASVHAITVLRRMGIDIQGHRARTLTQRAIDESDLLLTMTSRHTSYTVTVCPRPNILAHCL